MTLWLLAIATALLTWAMTGAYLHHMRAGNRVELPSPRSMHKAPLVTGAGAVVVAVIVAVWALWIQESLIGSPGLLLAATLALAAISWVDDQHGGLSPAIRLVVHALAVAALLLSLGADQRVVPAAPLAVERVLLGLGWLWFINLFNFMDGIDGLAATETISIVLGYILLVGFSAGDTSMPSLALIVSAAAAGYLVWNWHPAKVMMGDTGSIPLGFLLSWLMIDLGFRGYLAAAAILPLYFVADATLTLIMRALRGEKPWGSHREHAYQRAASATGSHAAVVHRVIATNALLVALAVLSIRYPITAVLGAIVVVAMLLVHLKQLSQGSTV